MSGTDVVLEALTGHSEGQLRELDRQPFMAKLGAIVNRFGVRGATEVIGVDRRTIQRWRTAIGRHYNPKAESAAKVDVAFRAALLRRPVPTPATLTIRTLDRDSGRPRTLDTSNLQLRPDTVDNMVARYLVGDYDGVVPAFLAGIGEAWYQSWLSGSWRTREEHRGQPTSGVVRDPRSDLHWVPDDFHVGRGGGGDYGAELVEMS